MKIIAIHGGTTFAKYEDYLESLRTKRLFPERLYFKPGWRENLGRDLGPGYDVYIPTMPNKANARYEEWAIWFGRILNVVDGPLVLIGHSLGAVFIAKYLSLNDLPQLAIATFLVAAPFADESGEELGDFKLDDITTRFRDQAGRVILFNGLDDPVIKMSELERYIDALPDARSIVLPAPDHFVRESFPELLDEIRALAHE